MVAFASLEICALHVKTEWKGTVGTDIISKQRFRLWGERKFESTWESILRKLFLVYSSSCISTFTSTWVTVFATVLVVKCRFWLWPLWSAHTNQAFTVWCTERVRWWYGGKYRAVVCHVFFWTLDGATDPRMNWSEGLRCHLVVSPAICFHAGSCEWHSSSCWKCIHHLHFTARSHRYIYFFVSAKPQIYSRGDLWLCFKSYRGSCCSDLTGFCGDRGRTGGLSSEWGVGKSFSGPAQTTCVSHIFREKVKMTYVSSLLLAESWSLFLFACRERKLCALEVRSRGVRDTLGVVCLAAPTSLHECVEWVGMMRYLRIGVKHEEPSGCPVRACFQSLFVHKI